MPNLADNKLITGDILSLKNAHVEKFTLRSCALNQTFTVCVCFETVRELEHMALELGLRSSE